ncbi:MAG: transcriptional repressor [Candidatus Brocadiia bacterium]
MIIRNTRQRDAIRNVFLSHVRPMSPAEILKHARGYAPKVGIATVYRNLKELCDDGFLTAIDVPGVAGSYYEQASRSTPQHFLCTKCQKLYPARGRISAIEKMVPDGFELSTHKVFLFGSCRECLKVPEMRAARGR